MAMVTRMMILLLIVLASVIVPTGAAPPASEQGMRAIYDQATGHATLAEGETPILVYNYKTVEIPDDLLDRVAPAAQKFALPRSDYIHPLYGPQGEVLTDDWSPDHPHHRGIYWAWPEVDFEESRGDLHALQQVFARPTGEIEVAASPKWGQIRAENVWRWEDETDIVHETVLLRAYPENQQGRLIDLTLTFTALVDRVSIARRETNHYGGLNFRFAALQQLAISEQNDPPSATPCRSWASLSGIPPSAKERVTLTIIQRRDNPHYPGGWVAYPELPWLQPLFPADGERYQLEKAKPLTLNYRLWIYRGQVANTNQLDRQWNAYQVGDAPPADQLDSPPSKTVLEGE